MLLENGLCLAQVTVAVKKEEAGWKRIYILAMRSPLIRSKLLHSR